MLQGRTSSSDIKGYKESALAQSENNDCVVRAIASAFKTDYDTAHAFVKERFGRKDKKGTQGTAVKLMQMEKNGETFNNKKVRTIPKEEITYIGSHRFQKTYNVVPKENEIPIPIVAQMMVEKFPKGTYIVLVRKHAYALIDGVIVGNSNDSEQKRKKILDMFEITDGDK